MKSEISPDKVVIIRIWNSEINGGENVGHVSLEIPKHKLYISLWPKNPIKLVGIGTFSPVTPEFQPDYNSDLKYEGREPEITVRLYSLRVDKMYAKFLEVKNKINQFTGWQLINGTLLFKISSQGRNCASLGYEILLEGEISFLISNKSSSLCYQMPSKFSSIISPDALGKLVESAKQNELKLYPHSANLNISDENSSIGSDYSWCCLF